MVKEEMILHINIFNSPPLRPHYWINQEGRADALVEWMGIL